MTRKIFGQFDITAATATLEKLGNYIGIVKLKTFSTISHDVALLGQFLKGLDHLSRDFVKSGYGLILLTLFK